MISARVLPLLCFVATTQAFGQIDTVRRGAAISIKVASFQQAQDEMFQQVAKHGGIAADRRQMSSEGGRHSGWTRVIVPKAQLDSFLADLRTLGKVYGEKLSLFDGASLYDDLGKRAERLKQHEQRLSNILTQRKGLRGSDILFVQERLYRASTDEDTLAEQRDAIPLQAAKSSVIVMLFEPTPIKEQPRGIAGHVKATFDEALRGLGLGLLGLVGPILNLLVFAVVLGAFWLLFRRPIRRVFGKLKSAPTPSSSGPAPSP